LDLKAGYLSNLNFHLILRRKSKENNFKSILQSIKNLIKEVNLFPSNFTDIILNKNFLNTQKTNYKINFNDEKFKSIKINNPKIKYKEKQLQAIKLGIQEGLSIIKGPPGTGKTDIAVEIINYLYKNNKKEKILIITHSNNVLNDLCQKIIESDIVEPKHLLRLGKGSKNIIINKENKEENNKKIEFENELNLSLDGKITYMLNQRKIFLDKFLKCMIENKITVYKEYTCQSALSLLDFYFMKNEINENLKKDIEKSMNLSLKEIIMELKNYLVYELIRDQAERRNFIITKQSKIIALTCTYCAINRQKLIDLNFNYDTIIMEESGQILEIESFIPMTLQKNMSNLKRVVLLGDENQLPPIVKSQAIRTQCLYHLSLFSRLLKSGYNNCVILNEQGRSRSEIVDLYRYKYENLIDMKEIIKKFNKNNFAFKYNIQFINVEEFNSKGEEINSNNSYYNLAEAEYSIGIFMYMCLVGYNPNQISILTTYNGQKELIKEIYNKKCGWNKLFNNIGKISTVDKYQGQQNDYIILSLVRTKKIGYLRDIRRFIVSLSRARQGLYILGKWDLFNNCLELNKTMNIFKDKYNYKNRKLELYLDGNENNIVEIDDFRHMYRLVQELIKIAMNNTKNEENTKTNI
jgi:intron-binding protein aquarius